MLTYSVERIKEFLPLCLEKLGRIALRHGCEILAPLGDGFKFSFPQTSNMTDVGTITNVLECFLEQLEIRSIDMGDQEFQQTSCRVCADYETLSEREQGDEIEFVPVVSSIDRIRWRTPEQANTIIVGDEFYKVIELFPILQERYRFEKKGDCVIDNVPYLIYQLSRSNQM